MPPIDCIYYNLILTLRHRGPHLIPLQLKHKWLIFEAKVTEKSAWIEEKEYKLGNIMNAWRLTLVGEGKGPGMFDISAFLGKEETLRRMKRAIEVLG